MTIMVLVVVHAALLYQAPSPKALVRRMSLVQSRMSLLGETQILKMLEAPRELHAPNPIGSSQL